MYPVRYIHAADLHLDAAFKGLKCAPEGAPALRRTLYEAGFTAMDRLFALAEREKPDFLVIAGDVYNQEDRSIRAQLRLRDACEHLAAFGVPVFLAHGNHDPLSSRLLSLNWPANVTVFDGEVKSRPVTREGETIAVVHGISHENFAESRNLALNFKRKKTPCFQLGVLHCAIEGSKAARYAPCTLEDLRVAGLDAWALGHVHEHAVLSKNNPFVLYSGNTQGLHIGERGERGCMLVNAAPSGNAFDCSAVFHALGPVIWELCELNLEHMSRIDEVDAALQQTVEKLAAEAPSGCEALMVRLRLTGRTPLDAELRRPGALTDLLERLHGLSVHPPVLIKDIENVTRPEADIQALRSGDNLLGEALRLTQAGRTDAASLRALVEPCLAKLRAKADAVLALSDEECAVLLDEAERLCMDFLENG